MGKAGLAHRSEENSQRQVGDEGRIEVGNDRAFGRVGQPHHGYPGERVEGARYSGRPPFRGGAGLFTEPIESAGITKSLKKKPKINPRIIDAVDEMVIKLSRETVKTSELKTREAVAALREQLARGMSRGEATEKLAARVKKIFHDPTRAYTIALTESRRATNAGQVMAARESGRARGMKWLTSPNGCRLCKKLNGKVVKFDKPFHVDKAGGPYAITYHPPLHPHCVCSLGEVY